MRYTSIALAALLAITITSPGRADTVSAVSIRVGSYPDRASWEAAWLNECASQLRAASHGAERYDDICARWLEHYQRLGPSPTGDYAIPVNWVEVTGPTLPCVTTRRTVVTHRRIIKRGMRDKRVRI